MTRWQEVQREVLEQKKRLRPATHTYGVVFVHGIGSQAQSSTLRENAEPLLRWLRDWHADRDARGFEVYASQLSYGAKLDGPARIYVHLPAYTLSLARQAAGQAALARRPGTERPEDERPREHDSENWVLTEGWWAARISAPSFLTMLEWVWRAARPSIRRVASALCDLDPRTVWGSGSQLQRARRSPLALAIETLSAIGLLFVCFVAVALAIPLLLLLLLLAQLPIRPLEEFIVLKLLRPFLVDKVGDVYIYLNDEPQALHARRGVEEAIEWLVDEESCEYVVVAGHSGGAVVAYDLLGTRGSQACAHDVPALRRVEALLTFGGALNAAWTPGAGPEPPVRVTDRLCEHVRWVDVWAAYDLVSAGAAAPRPPHAPPAEYVKVTNGLSVLVDHGGYWANDEEYQARLAQVISSPRNRHASRFWDPVRTAWSERRRDRVSTYVGWRVFAIVAFGVALWSRYRSGAAVADGNGLLALGEQTPLLGGVLKAARDLLDAPGMPQVVQTWGSEGVGLGAWAGVSLAFFLGVVRVVYEPWHMRERRRSVAPQASPTDQRLGILVRTLSVLVALGALAWLVSRAQPAEATLPGVLLVLAAFLAWWGIWLVAVRRSLGRGLVTVDP